MYIFLLVHVLVVFNIWLIYLGMKKIRANQNNIDKLAESIMKVKNQHKLICDAFVHLGDRVNNIGHKVMELDNNKTIQQKTDNSYTQAAKIADLGGNIDEMAVTCGISRAEAKLIATLRSSKAPNKVTNLD